MLNDIQKNLLKEVAGIESISLGAYNIRAEGALADRKTTESIDIITKKDNSGIDVIIKPNTIKQRVDLPVIITKTYSFISNGITLLCCFFIPTKSNFFVFFNSVTVHITIA